VYTLAPFFVQERLTDGRPTPHKKLSCNMAGIDDYQMYLAHQLSQEQREEWERKFDRDRQSDRMRPRNLRLQTSGLTRQQILQEEAIAEAEFQDGLEITFCASYCYLFSKSCMQLLTNILFAYKLKI